MTVADDLAILRSHTPEYDGHDAEFTAALDRVEAEAAWLRDGLRRIDRLAGEHDGVNEDAFEAITDITRPFLLAEDGAARDERCDKCGLPRDAHPGRLFCPAPGGAAPERDASGGGRWRG